VLAGLPGVNREYGGFAAATHQGRYSAGMTSADSFLERRELDLVGFRTVGTNVRISRFARFFNPGAIEIGDEVRIDDFAILSPGAGTIRFEGFNHVAAAAMIFGEVTLRPWSTLSSRVVVYAVTDDFTIDAATYPHSGQRNLVRAPVVIGERVVVGTGSTVLPGVEIVSGVSIGAMSLVRRSVLEPGVYAGIPVRRIASRRPRPPGNAD
jgi:acetyltransferase-like isoleucine patch superfamily enzyme